MRSIPPTIECGLSPIELNVLIGCGGVAVYPSDLVFGDTTGVVVLPRCLAEEMAETAAMMGWRVTSLEKVQRERALFGTFPHDPNPRARHRAHAFGQAK